MHEVPPAQDLRKAVIQTRKDRVHSLGASRHGWCSPEMAMLKPTRLVFPLPSYDSDSTRLLFVNGENPENPSATVPWPFTWLVTAVTAALASMGTRFPLITGVNIQARTVSDVVSTLTLVLTRDASKEQPVNSVPTWDQPLTLRSARSLSTVTILRPRSDSTRIASPRGVFRKQIRQQIFRHQ
jgi:hypothetical protein